MVDMYREREKEAEKGREGEREGGRGRCNLQLGRRLEQSGKCGPPKTRIQGEDGLTFFTMDTHTHTRELPTPQSHIQTHTCHPTHPSARRHRTPARSMYPHTHKTELRPRTWQGYDPKTPHTPPSHPSHAYRQNTYLHV